MTYLSRIIASIFFAILFIPSTLADDTISRGDAFIYLADKVSSDIPNSYTYIDLYYNGVDESSQEGRALQKLIYLDFINNTSSDLGLDKKINFHLFEALAIKILNLQISSDITLEQKQTTYVKQSDLFALETLIHEKTVSEQENSNISGLPDTAKILTDVYETLNASHYDRENITDQQIIQGAIKGAADSLGDKYTTYFPPVESKNFNEGLDGSFEGIGAYIEMSTPGELIIISPIVGSPAEQAGIKGGDRVMFVDGKEITPENSVEEVVSWIKGPKGSTVELTIMREGREDYFILTVTRDTIIVKNVEYEKISQDTFYIQIKGFGDNVTSEFKEALEEINNDSSVKKIIFDLRNNPGGYLDEVAYMLSYFVPEGQATAIIDYGDNEKEYISRGYDLLDTNKYEFVFLQNGGSASASEIMIGTMKDYFPDSTIIGEKSFGKGSVQSLKSYYDGSTLKYTTAKWFTGKTKTGIDGVGITPDIEIELNIEDFRETGVDNQLERAKSN